MSTPNKSRKPSAEQIRSLLTTPHFGGDHGAIAPQVPTSESSYPIDIFEIDHYDRNPRRVRNEKYDEIKESIRAKGLENPLIVTQRPDSERFMLKAGGNTRLSILRELYAETPDEKLREKFRWPRCIFRPWTSETDVMISHLVENETRGDLILIDKARAVREARELLSAELQRTIPLRELADLLRARGFKVSLSWLSIYDYAIDALADATPTALNAGMGRPGIDRIRKLDRAAVAVWNRRQLGTPEIYRAMFSEALARADRDDWDVELARKMIESALAERAGVEARHMSLELGAELEYPAERHADEPEMKPTGDLLPHERVALRAAQSSAPAADLPPDHPNEVSTAQQTLPALDRPAAQKATDTRSKRPPADPSDTSHFIRDDGGDDRGGTGDAEFEPSEELDEPFEHDDLSAAHSFAAHSNEVGHANVGTSAADLRLASLSAHPLAQAGLSLVLQARVMSEVQPVAADGLALPENPEHWAGITALRAEVVRYAQYFASLFGLDSLIRTDMVPANRSGYYLTGMPMKIAPLTPWPDGTVYAWTILLACALHEQSSLHILNSAPIGTENPHLLPDLERIFGGHAEPDFLDYLLQGAVHKRRIGLDIGEWISLTPSESWDAECALRVAMRRLSEYCNNLHVIDFGAGYPRFTTGRQP